MDIHIIQRSQKEIDSFIAIMAENGLWVTQENGRFNENTGLWCVDLLIERAIDVNTGERIG